MNTRMRYLISIAVVGGLSTGALAATQVIHQQGRAFSIESITVKKGEPITFLNDDSVPHNIMSASAGNEFNLGSDLPNAADWRPPIVTGTENSPTGPGVLSGGGDSRSPTIGIAAACR